MALEAQHVATYRSARRGVVRDALGIGIATGAYALSFGALSTAAGLSVLQTCFLSLAVFTGASQFALVGVVASGGTLTAGAATAVLLGTRNALYGLRLSSLLRLRGVRRLLGAQLVIDESTAMAVARDDAELGRVGFWATGLAVYTFWNLGTLLGALGGAALSDPKVLGLDAAPPAAYVALLAPRLRAREPWAVALTAAAVSLAAVPFLPNGAPVLLAALAALVALRRSA
jgi:predicted branched-subunit amino acid permease